MQEAMHVDESPEDRSGPIVESINRHIKNTQLHITSPRTHADGLTAVQSLLLESIIVPKIFDAGEDASGAMYDFCAYIEVRQDMCEYLAENAPPKMLADFLTDVEDHPTIRKALLYTEDAFWISTYLSKTGNKHKEMVEVLISSADVSAHLQYLMHVENDDKVVWAMIGATVSHGLHLVNYTRFVGYREDVVSALIKSRDVEACKEFLKDIEENPDVRAVVELGERMH